MNSLLLLALMGPAFASGPPDFDAHARSFRDTLAALVKADMTNPPGNEARGVDILAKRLSAADIPYQITEFAPGRKNLVARLKGSGQKRPLLLLAHIDVVGVKDQVWTTAPYELTEKDGFFYGRGVVDDLGSAAVHLEVLIAIQASGLKLQRDLIVAFTGDEESGGGGIRYLLEKHPEMIDADMALNEGGAPLLRADGKHKYVALQVAEKTYQDYTLITKGQTGHSSVPRGNNAIYRLSRALTRLASFQAERRLIPATRAYFNALAAVEEPKKAKAMRALVAARGKLPQWALDEVEESPRFASMLTTSCVATLVSGGSRANALPAEARANVNCRLLPDETPEQVRERLRKVVSDPEVEITLDNSFGSAPASPVDSEVTRTIAKLVEETWPGTPVVPMMQTGATDSRFLRLRGIPAYGFTPLAMYEADTVRAHGIDERLPVASVRPGIELLYRVVTRLAASQ